ncbi:hypothetical protein RHI9324_05134 [Rhizobium sp. CECT 9324]|nr:hypothetical protein RHI9324_05134 [Rhizobium sp. CECT 9324]
MVSDTSPMFGTLLFPCLHGSLAPDRNGRVAGSEGEGLSTTSRFTADCLARYLLSNLLDQAPWAKCCFIEHAAGITELLSIPQSTSDWLADLLRHHGQQRMGVYRHREALETRPGQDIALDEKNAEVVQNLQLLGAFYPLAERHNVKFLEHA